MPRSTSSGFASIDANSLAARLHDTSAEIALGLGLLRPEPRRISYRSRQAVAILDQALDHLKQLTADVTRQGSRLAAADLVPGFQRQAALLGLAVELRVVGTMHELAPCFIDLLDLVGREALANVRRHSGARACEIELDFTVVPFVLRARDGGIGPGAHAEAGRGLSTLRDLARWLGCELRVSSPPGVGTELVLTGPESAATFRELGTGPVPQEVANS